MDFISFRLCRRLPTISSSRPSVGERYAHATLLCAPLKNEWSRARRCFLLLVHVASILLSMRWKFVFQLPTRDAIFIWKKNQGEKGKSSFTLSGGYELYFMVVEHDDVHLRRFAALTWLNSSNMLLRVDEEAQSIACFRCMTTALYVAY